MRTTKRLLSAILSVLIVISSLLISAFNTSAATIPDDAFEYNGHLYKVYSNVCSTWEAAKRFCEDMGGHLAVISSKEENTAVYSYIRSLGYHNAYFGLTDSAKEGTWVWVNDEKSSYRNWNSGEPNSERYNEDYAMFYYKYSNGTWNDGNFAQGTVGDDGNFICEWDIVRDGALIGTLDDYVITVVFDNPNESGVYEITVDGVKYSVAQGVLSVETAKIYEGKEVCLHVEDGVVTWINLLSNIKTEPSVSLNSVAQTDLTYKGGQFSKKKVALTGNVRNKFTSNVLSDVQELLKSRNEYSLSDVSLTLTSGDTDIVYFKKYALLPGKDRSITFDIADKMSAADSITFGGKAFDIKKEIYMYINAEYDFPENLKEKSVAIEYTLNAKQNGRPVTCSGTLALNFVNDDYGKNDKVNIEAAKKNWKKQPLDEFLDDLLDKAEVYETATNKTSGPVTWQLHGLIATNDGKDMLNTLMGKYSALNHIYEVDCQIDGCDVKKVEEVGEQILQSIIDDCREETGELIGDLERDLRARLESVFHNHHFNDFIIWYKENELQVVKGTRKRTDYKCPINITITDEDGNIVASIVNDEVVFTAEGVSAYVNKDTRLKTVYLPTYIDHRVQVTATDNGTMDYSVTEYNASGDEVVVSYEDIPLTKDKVCTGVVVMGSMPEEGSYELTEMTLDKLSFSGASLTLQDNICINYKANETLFTEVGYENPFVLFEMNGEKSIVSDYRVVDGKYVFDYSNISPANMNDTVKATLYATYDGATYVSETREYSVATYCYNMLSKYNIEEYAELRTLLVDLLNYGAAAQTYIDYKTDDLVNADLTEEQLAWGTGEVPAYETVQNLAYKTIENPTVQWLGGGLNLKDSVEMRFKISAENYDNLTIKAETSDNEWTITSDTFAVVPDGCYFFFDALDASQMSEPVYFTVYDGDTAVSNTICYSIESYAYIQQNNTDEKLVNLLSAMMRYGIAAKDYADNCVVTFVYYSENGETIIYDKRTVDCNTSASAPKVPLRNDGWVFYGWDTDFSNVTKDITVTAIYSNQNVQLLGDVIGSWTISDANRMTYNSNEINTKTLTLPKGTYELKIYTEEWGCWLGNNGTVNDSCRNWDMIEGTNNLTLNASGGTYTFTFNRITQKLSISYTGQ